MADGQPVKKIDSDQLVKTLSDLVWLLTDSERSVIERHIREILETAPASKKEPHWTDKCVALNFEGEVISAFGEPGPAGPTGGMTFTYPVRTVSDALRIHNAWHDWTRARSDLWRLPIKKQTPDVHANLVRLEDVYNKIRQDLEIEI